MRQWQVEPSLIYGQVKKCYRRRKLVRVSHVMRLGTEAALTASLQGMGFSGRLNTAFIERVNLTVRHGVAAQVLLARAATPWQEGPGRRLSRPHSCWPVWSGGELTTILSVPTNRCG